jgi:hypothetical protein
MTCREFPGGRSSVWTKAGYGLLIVDAPPVMNTTGAKSSVVPERTGTFSISFGIIRDPSSEGIKSVTNSNLICWFFELEFDIRNRPATECELGTQYSLFTSIELNGV